MANYQVDPSLLQEFVPRGTELDLWNGECYVSLVSFKFVDTRVKGIRIPGHSNFEEVNLRFYVKRDAGEEIRRGVTFIKEIVPKAMISFVARTLYGEPYETWQMSHEAGKRDLTYLWEKEDVENRVHVEVSREMGVPAAGSHEEFIIEHYWGYTRRGENRTDEYKVEHPKWSVFELNYAEIDVDFGYTYGEEFAFLSDEEPRSIFMAKGSPVSVYQGRRLRFR